MTYIAKRRARLKSLSGQINLPYGTKVMRRDKTLYHDRKPICFVTSHTAHEYFARDDDGHGEERGKLTIAIKNTLNMRDKDHQSRWDRVWADALCQRYKRPEHQDFWLWNHEFYEAHIVDLRYIAQLVGAKIK